MKRRSRKKEGRRKPDTYKDYKVLFIHLREREREREHAQREGLMEREKQALDRAPNSGLDPRILGS